MYTGNGNDNYELETLERANHQGSPNNKSQTNPTHLLVPPAHRRLSVFVNVVSRCNLFPKARILDTPGFVNTRGPPRSQTSPTRGVPRLEHVCFRRWRYTHDRIRGYVRAWGRQNGEHPGHWSRNQHDTEGLSLSAIKCSVAPSTSSGHPQLSTD